MAAPQERSVKRNRWHGFVNGFSSGIGFTIFLVVIIIWLTRENTPQATDIIGWVILAIIAGLSIFLLSLTVEIHTQARIGPPLPVMEEIPPANKLCPRCGSEMKYVSQHRKFYCQNCKVYEEPNPA